MKYSSAELAEMYYKALQLENEARRLHWEAEGKIEIPKLEREMKQLDLEYKALQDSLPEDDDDSGEQDSEKTYHQMRMLSAKKRQILMKIRDYSNPAHTTQYSKID